MNQQLQDYIEQSYKLGKTNEEIRQELLNTGWDVKDIEDNLVTATSASSGISKKNLTPKFLGLIIGLLVLGGVASGSILYYQNQSVSVVVSSFTPRPTPEVTNIIASGSNEVVKVTIQTDVATITSCGNQACFEAKFVKCEKATFDATALGATFHYEIIGYQSKYCQVKSKFISNPNQSWIGKEMICGYDNTKSFLDAVKDMNRCSGPLYDLMTGR